MINTSKDRRKSGKEKGVTPMKKHLRFLSVLLCILTALTLAAPALAEAGHGPLWIGDYTLTCWAPMNGNAAQYYESYAEHPFYLWMEEQTGVHVEFIHYSSEQMDQQLNLMMVSGNYYDMLINPWYNGGPQQAINDGVYADLNQFKDLMPHYFAGIEPGNEDSFAAWEWGSEKELYGLGKQTGWKDTLTTAQGQLWCVTQLWLDEIPSECGGLIRQDWLDEAELAVPETLDDLEKVLAVFKERGDDVIPMALGQNGIYESDMYLNSAFDLRSWYSQENGVVQVPCLVDDRAKDYLTLMNKWYEAGYIDPGFMSRDDEGIESLLLSDRLGVWPESYAGPEYYEALYTGSQNFDLTAMAAPRKTADQQLHMKQGYDSSAANFTIICGKSAPETQQVAARWLDTLFTKEAILRANYGVEGVDYTMVDGHPYYTEEFLNRFEDEKLADIYLCPNLTYYWSTRANLIRTVAEPTIAAQMTTISLDAQNGVIWGEHADREYEIGYVVFDDDGWQRMYDPYTEAITYCSAEFIKFIIGKNSLDNFEAYQQKGLDMGFREARDRMQEAYNVQHHLDKDYGMDLVK